MNRARGGSRRPNRSGGRFNKPRTANRSGLSASIEKDQDELGDSEDDEYLDDTLAGNCKTSQAEKNMILAKSKSKFRNKALIQRLDMNVENREMIEEVLRDLKIAGSGQELTDNLDLDAREICILFRTM